MSVLPAGEADITNDLVDVAHDALDHDGRLLILHFLEQVRKRGLAQRLVRDRLGGLLRSAHERDQEPGGEKALVKRTGHLVDLIRGDVHDMKIALGPLTRTLADLEESVRYLDKRVSRLEKAGHKDD